MAAPANRPAWQVLTLALGIVVGTLAAVVLVVAVATATAPLSPLPGRLHQAAVGLPLILLLYAGVARVAGVSADAVRAERPGIGILAWIALGLVFPSALLGIQLAAIGASLVGELPGAAQVAGALAASLLAGLLAGVLEELALRGALLALLERRWGPRVGVVGSATVFAALHQGHAGSPAALAAVAAAMFAAGLWLGVATVRSGSVWVAVALHAGWNTVYGGRLVSTAGPGEPLGEALLPFRVSAAHTVLDGGAAGLPAAPLATVALLLATAALLALEPERLRTRPKAARVDQTQRQP